MNDFRYALRSLLHKPGFALTAIVSMALGIGANATVFSFADGMLLRPLPVPDPGRVVTVRSRTPSGTFGNLSFADFRDMRDRNRSFAGLAAYRLMPFGFANDPKQQPSMKAGLLVSGNFFDVLKVAPTLGRSFRPEEDKAAGRDAVVVLGHDLWKTEFGSAASVIGREIELNGIRFTVIGVAPESFTGMDQYFHPGLYVPAMMAPKLLSANADALTDRANRAFAVKGRLKPGVSIGAADGEMAAIAHSLAESFASTNVGYGAAVRSELQARQDVSPGDAAIVGFLLTIGTVVLLIACANVANLILSRGRSRSREIAIRLAIGAGRSSIVRELLAESLLIALAGGALGLLITQVGIDFGSSLQIPSDIPIELTLKLDHRVLGFTLLAAVLSAVLFGLAPALRATKTDLVSGLKAGLSAGVKDRFRGRNTLVIVQLAGSLVLLIAATQLFRGFSYVLARDPGFAIDHRLTMSFDPSLVRYSPEQSKMFYKNLSDRVRELPGVKSATLAVSVPLAQNFEQETVTPEGYQFPKGQHGAATFANTIDESYFKTMGVPVILGRGFLPSDIASSPQVAVVNEQFLTRYGIKNPLRSRLRLGDASGPWVRIVGVTGTGKYLALEEPPLEVIYLPRAQHFVSRSTLIVDTKGSPTALVAPLRNVIKSLAPGLPVYGVRTMEELFDQRSVKVMHLLNGVVGSVGLIGLALSLVGLYAVVAYHVSRRTREIGIRMAVGADKPQVLGMFLKQAGKMGGIGIAAGMMISIAAGRVLSSALDVPSFDPVLFAVVVVGLMVTTLLAALIPARRAAQIDPMLAIRQD